LSGRADGGRAKMRHPKNRKPGKTALPLSGFLSAIDLRDSFIFSGGGE
jgi:hypothetical protein